VIPGILIAGVIALPFLDRSVERRPWKRPVAMTAYAVVALALIGLGLRSHYLDRTDGGVSQQLAKQDAEEKAYMSKPFEPELSSASLTAANVSLGDPLAAKGKSVFEAQTCNACHGDGGVGTAAAPALTGVGAKLSVEQMHNLLLHPNEKMTSGGMPTVDLSAQDLAALIAYVRSLK
jgi:mono/diheme cytochrome c family protein